MMMTQRPPPFIYSVLYNRSKINIIGFYCIICMKYNNTLFNKIFNTINNNTSNNNNNNNNNNDHININTSNSTTNNNKNDIKVSPPTTTSINNMAAVINNTPISNSIVATSTRFTDEYDLKEELGK